MNENRNVETVPGESQPETHGPSVLAEHVAAVDEEVDQLTGHSTRSSMRLSRKRDSDRSSEEDSLLNRNRLLSVSNDVPISRFNESPSQLCLCQPDPKVPRPRNAFILFRQHHQAAVVAQNPGLANPDISKIIGDAWRSSSSDVKNHWKRLADEEKIRHQKQYPDYRYQPRRAGRNSVTASMATDPDTQRCLKCGGKTMPTPHNLPTPGISTTPVSTRSPAAHGSQQPGGGNVNRLPQFVPSPTLLPGNINLRHQPAGAGPLVFRAVSRGHPEPTASLAPELKRRRIEDAYMHAQRQGNGTVVSSHPQSMHRPSLVRPELGPKNSNQIVSRSQVPTAAAAAVTSSHQHAMSLAPLKLDEAKNPTAQAKAVEAMVMSIPTLNKIKLLAKISPPLPNPGPASPPYATRGALLAVDGNDEEALKTVIAYLKDHLERDEDYQVRVFSKSGPNRCETFPEWMDLMRAYHEQSEEIIRFITTFPMDTSSSADVASRSIANKGSASNNSSPVSSKTVKSPNKQRRSSQKVIASETEGAENKATGAESDFDGVIDVTVHSDIPNNAMPRTSADFRQSALLYETSRSPIPVALVPRYQLTLTDAAASAVPIVDEYSPTDHWQWMATLWRGVVGPDVTVDVRSQFGIDSLYQANGGNGGGSFASPIGSGEGGSGSRPGETPNLVSKGGAATGGAGPAVSVKLQEARAVLLRAESRGKVSETALRRTGFEVGEYLRAVGEREREHEREREGEK